MHSYVAEIIFPRVGIIGGKKVFRLILYNYVKMNTTEAVFAPHNAWYTPPASHVMIYNQLTGCEQDGAIKGHLSSCMYISNKIQKQATAKAAWLTCTSICLNC